jgi:hypothetical protein
MDIQEDNVIIIEALEQYEAIRKSGEINVMDYDAVMEIAEQNEFWELFQLNRADYAYLLQNYTRLMALYKVAQNIRVDNPPTKMVD